MRYPEVTSLYKYRAFNKYSLQSLINEAAWFSTPASFNDPFDCGIHIDQHKMDESIRVAVKEAYFKAGKSIDQIPPEDLNAREEDKQAFQYFRSTLYELFQNIGIFSLSRINNDLRYVLLIFRHNYAIHPNHLSSWRYSGIGCWQPL